MPRSTKYMLRVVAPWAFAIALPAGVIIYELGFNPTAVANGIRAVLTLGRAG